MKKNMLFSSKVLQSKQAGKAQNQTLAQMVLEIMVTALLL